MIAGFCTTAEVQDIWHGQPVSGLTEDGRERIKAMLQSYIEGGPIALDESGEPAASQWQPLTAQLNHDLARRHAELTVTEYSVTFSSPGPAQYLRALLSGRGLGWREAGDPDSRRFVLRASAVRELSGTEYITQDDCGASMWLRGRGYPLMPESREP